MAASREYLQSIIQELEAANEELQSANEEILSSNEELQSTNEELDTAKEELQSTNEELNTLNEELHSRNDELARVNGDLVNLLGGVDLSIVIVGNDLKIRRFTPAAETLFNLIPGDIGRSIDQIKPNVVCDDLTGLIRRTIDHVEMQEQEVPDSSGRWYLLRIRPYRGVDNHLDGAVMTAIDIDDRKRHARQVERSRDIVIKTAETIGQPMLLLDNDLRVRWANKQFYATFQTAVQQTEGVSIDQLGNGAWNIPAVRELLAGAAADDASHQAVIEHRFPSIGERRLGLSARAVSLDDSKPCILLAVTSNDAQTTKTTQDPS